VLRPRQSHPKPAGKSAGSAGAGAREEAERIAVAALGFIAGDSQRLDRFLALTGLDPVGLRDAAARPGFFSAVLDHLAGHEPDLLAFAAEANLSPEKVVAARRALGGRDFWND
jgi:hypothetical protein